MPATPRRALRRKRSGDAFFVVDVAFRSTGEGGRRTAFPSGYRCPAFLGGAPDEPPKTADGAYGPMSDCAILFEAAHVQPGETVRARLLPFAPEAWLRVRVGDTIGLYEPPSRRVATAAIVEPISERQP